MKKVLILLVALCAFFPTAIFSQNVTSIDTTTVGVTWKVTRITYEDYSRLWELDNGAQIYFYSEKEGAFTCVNAKARIGNEGLEVPWFCPCEGKTENPPIDLFFLSHEWPQNGTENNPVAFNYQISESSVRLYRTATVDLSKKQAKVAYGPWHPVKRIVQAWADEKNENPNLLCAVKDSLVMTDEELVSAVLSNTIQREKKIDAKLDAENPTIYDTFWSKLLFVNLDSKSGILFEKTGRLNGKDELYRTTFLGIKMEWSFQNKTANVCIYNTDIHRFVINGDNLKYVNEREIFLAPSFRKMYESALIALQQQE